MRFFFFTANDGLLEVADLGAAAPIRFCATAGDTTVEGLAEGAEIDGVAIGATMVGVAVAGIAGAAIFGT